jgi:hypothetical protein
LVSAPADIKVGSVDHVRTSRRKDIWFSFDPVVGCLSHDLAVRVFQNKLFGAKRGSRRAGPGSHPHGHCRIKKQVLKRIHSGKKGHAKDKNIGKLVRDGLGLSCDNSDAVSREARMAHGPFAVSRGHFHQPTAAEFFASHFNICSPYKEYTVLLFHLLFVSSEV